MAEEPTTQPEGEQDPAAETPDSTDQAEPEETPEPEAQVDWKTRYEEAQKTIGRQGHELGLLRKGEKPEPTEQPDETDEGDDEGDEPEAKPKPNRRAERQEAESLHLATLLYGEDAIEAYDAAQRVAQRAVTLADWIASYEAYHEIRSGGGAKPKPAEPEGTKPPTREQALAPRVDPNRSDAGPDPSIAAKHEEARKSGDLPGFVKSAVRMMGLGGEPKG